MKIIQERGVPRGTQDEDNQNNNTICIGHHNTQANTNNVNTYLGRYVNTVVWSSQITEIMYSNQKYKMKLVGKRLLYLKFEFCLCCLSRDTNKPILPLYLFMFAPNDANLIKLMTVPLTKLHGYDICGMSIMLLYYDTVKTFISMLTF
jgi:hypothetical protein